MKRNLETHWEHNFIKSMAIFSIFIIKPQWDFDPAPSGINGTISSDFSGHLSWTVCANHSNGEWCEQRARKEFVNFIQSSASGKGLTAARDGRLLASANVSFGAQRGQLSCGSDCGGIQSCSEVVVLFHTVLLGGKHNQQNPRAWRLVEMAVGTKNDFGRKNNWKPKSLKKLRLSSISIWKGTI